MCIYIYVYIYIIIYIYTHTLYIDKVNKLYKHCYIVSLKKRGFNRDRAMAIPCPSPGDPHFGGAVRGGIGVLDLDQWTHPGHGYPVVMTNIAMENLHV